MNTRVAMASRYRIQYPYIGNVSGYGLEQLGYHVDQYMILTAGLYFVMLGKKKPIKFRLRLRPNVESAIVDVNSYPKARFVYSSRAFGG